MTLSTLAILIGVGFCIPQVYGLMNPEGFVRQVRSFPRSQTWGYVLMAAGAAWFLINLNRETIADFAAYKNIMLFGFGALALLTCVFVRDFLAVRGLAVFLLMLAWFTLNHTRWAESPCRLVLVVWAYLWVVGSMWLTVSPWRLRDFLHWATATPQRIKVGCALRLAFDILVVVLGMTAFRA